MHRRCAPSSCCVGNDGDRSQQLGAMSSRTGFLSEFADRFPRAFCHRSLGRGAGFLLLARPSQMKRVTMVCSRYRGLLNAAEAFWQNPKLRQTFKTFVVTAKIRIVYHANGDQSVDSPQAHVSGGQWDWPSSRGHGSATCGFAHGRFEPGVPWNASARAWRAFKPCTRAGPGGRARVQGSRSHSATRPTRESAGDETDARRAAFGGHRGSREPGRQERGRLRWRKMLAAPARCSASVLGTRSRTPWAALWGSTRTFTVQA